MKPMWEMSEFKNRLLSKYSLELLALADESQMYSGDRVAILASRLLELEVENARLKEQMRWIPINERMPEDGQSVFVYNRTVPGCDIVTYYHRMWISGEIELPTELYKDIFTHWMSFPPSPEAE